MFCWNSYNLHKNIRYILSQWLSNYLPKDKNIFFSQKERKYKSSKKIWFETFFFIFEMETDHFWSPLALLVIIFICAKVNLDNKKAHYCGIFFKPKSIFYKDKQPLNRNSKVCQVINPQNPRIINSWPLFVWIPRTRPKWITFFSYIVVHHLGIIIATAHYSCGLAFEVTVAHVLRFFS